LGKSFRDLEIVSTLFASRRIGLWEQIVFNRFRHHYRSRFKNAFCRFKLLAVTYVNLDDLRIVENTVCAWPLERAVDYTAVACLCILFG
jgi:hypothetical protein